MNPAEFQAIYQAERVRLAATQAVMAKSYALLLDFDGKPMVDGEALRDGFTCGDLRTLVHEVERLKDQVARQQKEAREAERDFQREAREIAAEARWQDQNDRDGVPHGTY